MPLEIHEKSHLDHGLSSEHVAYILGLFNDRTGFFRETVTLPAGLSALLCGLYGPTVGDAPVPEAEAFYIVREDRSYASRTVWREGRPSRELSVIAGPFEGRPCVLYTAFGGPLTPREPGDLNIATWEELVEARRFWAEHALVSPD